MVTFELGDLVSKLNIASKGHLTSIFVRRSRMSVELLSILYINGLIRGFNVQGNTLKVFLKYYQNKSLFKELKLVSTPGRRVFWTLNYLSNKFNNNAFSGFYILSTNKGLITSNSALLSSFLSGEVILKISV